jgi:hypothetical protein
MPILTTVTKAQGTLTLTTVANTETCVLGGKTYTFQTTLTDVDGNVKIGADVTGSAANLVAAINLAAGSGTTYAASMTANDLVSAASADAVVTLSALVGGTIGDLIGIAQSFTSGAVDAATLGTATAGAGSLAVAMAESHARLTTILGVSQANAHIIKDLNLLITEMDGAD